MIDRSLEGNAYFQSIRLMPIPTRSKRHRLEVDCKEKMADQSIFKNLMDEALGPINKNLNY